MQLLQVVTQTEAFGKLDEGTVKDFIMKVRQLQKIPIYTVKLQAAQSGAFKS